MLCVDEKSPVQALARSQPAFPMMSGRPAKRTLDYVRHGTTGLGVPLLGAPSGGVAAFNTADAPSSPASTADTQGWATRVQRRPGDSRYSLRYEMQEMVDSVDARGTTLGGTC